MVKQGRKVAHEEPAEKPDPLGLRVVMVVIALTGALLGADHYIDGRLADIEKSLSDASERFKTVDRSLSDLSTGMTGRLKTMNDSLSGLSTNIHQTLSRVSALETRLSQMSEYVASGTFDTVYVFKHTFDFPKPSFDLERDEARDLICTSDELPTTDELREEKELYRKAIFAFDASVQFKFYTMGQGKDEAVQSMIRQEMACYKRTRRRNETVPRERRITQAPVEIQLETESAIYSDDNGGTWSRPYDPSFDHDDGDSKTYIFSGLPERGGPQVHSLTATIVDREKRPDQEFCQNYEIEVATRRLDRCDLEVFVFAYLDSPPLPPPPTTEE